MLLVELIPLRPPEEGWKANWTLWVRVFVSSIFVGGGIVFLSRAIISEARISILRAVGITIVSAVLYTGLGVLLAATWKFPVPFGMVLMVCPFVSIIMSQILVSIDPKELRTNKKLQKQLIGHFIGTSAQSLLVVAYPTFNAVFLHLSEVEQAVFMLVLPVIKFITKQTIAKVATHLQDFIGVLIVFSVDVFNVLYVAICMQTARSSLTTMLIMSSDVLHVVFALRNIYYHTNHVQQQFSNERDSSNYIDKVVKNVGNFNPRTNPYAGPIRLFMPYKLLLSNSSAEFLLNLDRKWNHTTPCRQEATEAELPAVRRAIGPSNQLIPKEITPQTESRAPNQVNSGSRQVSIVPALINSQRSTRRSVGGGSKFERCLTEELQVLFHCEYVMMSEYIECILFLVYAGYLAALYRLPTAAYYPFTRSLMPAKLNSTLIQLVIYGVLEFLSFVGLHVLLKNRLGYSPLYQLAFVLETHAALVQSLLFLWVLFIVQLTLVHAGVDFNVPFGK
ncbi:hypothetical protein V7S43_018305 [Phytophthora oleae]|uniref:Uncharacterized protein n=1 Tax=Phytophthora oleae TaxID=2107226 RepID=A0ABD3ERD3_9STRA